MPYRTFEDASREIARADGRVSPERLEAMEKEYAERVEASRQEVRRLGEGQRANLEARLADLVRASKRNYAALKKADEQRALHRLTLEQFNERVKRLAMDQRVVKVKAQRVRARLELLDARLANPTESVDRIARHTGLGKQHFSF